MTDFEELIAGDVTARAYVRVPNGAEAGVVVLHPWWGLNDDVLGFADRLADANFAVHAPDMFDGQAASTIEDADRLAGSSDEDRIKPIVLAAFDQLSARISAGPVAALGFSFGAAWAMWVPTQRPDARASIVYYGTWTGSVLGRAKVPVLGHFAEHDPYETEETVVEFEQGLRDAGRDAEIHRYPGAGHWFAEPSRDAYRPAASTLAFGRTVEFLQKHLESD